MSESELGPLPEPEIEPGEPNRGGVDALGDHSGPIAIPDLTPEENPALEDKAPETVKQKVSDSEDTSTQATRSADGNGSGPKQEPPA